MTSILFSGVSQASIINGGFETGDLSGWTSIGVTSVVDASYGTGPVSGSFNALLETGFEKTTGVATTGFSDTAIETFLGLPLGAFDLFVIDATEGSSMKQSFAANVGDSIAFNYIMLADDCDLVECPGAVEDFAFVSLFVDNILHDFQVLSSTFGSVAAGSGSPYFAESNVLSFSHTLITGGIVELGITILDGGDTIVPGGILVDSIGGVTVIPEPGTASLLGLGLIGLVLAGHRRN